MSMQRFCLPTGRTVDQQKDDSQVKCYGYLDIETTGFSCQYCDLTVVGVALVRAGQPRFGQLYGGQINADRVLEPAGRRGRNLHVQRQPVRSAVHQRQSRSRPAQAIRPHGPHVQLLAQGLERRPEGRRGPPRHRAASDRHERLHGRAALVGLREQQRHARPCNGCSNTTGRT